MPGNHGVPSPEATPAAAVPSGVARARASSLTPESRSVGSGPSQERGGEEGPAHRKSVIPGNLQSE